VRAAAGALLVAAILASPASAATGTGDDGAPATGERDYAALADRAARAWVPLQYEKGAFVDPYSRQRSRGYGVGMIGYALLRAGLRADRGGARIRQAGARALRDELRDPAKGGVFDQWTAALSYDFAHRRLARDSAWTGVAARLRAFLRGLGAPRLGPGEGACFLSPTCYSNHKIVQAEAELELAASGLRSDAKALRADALRTVGPFAAGAFGRSGRASGPGPRRGLGVLSDTGVWPLGYHALSTMMLARAAWRERDKLPAPLRDNLRRALDTLAAYAAPDGDVAYIGTRHQQAWIPAATAYGAEVGARLFAADRARSGRYAALADRAFARLRRFHGRSPSGVLAPVPRMAREATYLPDGDVDAEATNGLALVALDLAADVARRPRPAQATTLPADGPSWYSERGETGFAATRRGPIWFAVRRQQRVLPGGRVPDLSFDAGLVALQRLGADGRWRALTAARPRRALGLASLGPRLVTAAGTGLPAGERIRARPGKIMVSGGFRTADGRWLRQGVRFRYQATSRGVRLRFPARPGDRLELTVLLRGRGSATRRGVADRRAVTTARPRPEVALATGPPASTCCERAVTPALLTIVPARDGDVAITVTGRGPGAAPEPGARAAAGVGAQAR
jgi:hypothetical protein